MTCALRLLAWLARLPWLRWLSEPPRWEPRLRDDAAPALCDMLETAGLAEAVVDPAEGTATGLILPPSHVAPDTDIAVFLERSVASANASLRDGVGP